MLEPLVDLESMAQLTPELREVLASFVHKNKHKYNVESPQERVNEFARSLLNKTHFPYDIKNYLYNSTARRFKQNGFKRALSFIELRCEQIAHTFSALPVPWYLLDSELKRARFALDQSALANMHVRDSVKLGLSLFDTLMIVNKHVEMSMWMPGFEFSVEVKDKEADYFAVLHRACDESWWLRVIGKAVIATFESARRAAGMVSPSVSPYASHSNCNWFKERQKRQLEWLHMIELKSECGETLDMMDVRNASIANPVIRRYELMARIRGCQEYADSIGFVALFVTLTAPGKYHRLKKRGKYFVENKKWNGSPPEAAHRWIASAWEKFRSAAGRETKKRPELNYFGMRVVEPHVDATPHWHGVFFVEPAHVEIFTALLIKYQTRFDSEELYFENGMLNTKAKKARVDIKVIDRNKGDAVAYIAKYISKNIDGHGLKGLTDLDSKAVNLVNSIVNVTSWSRSYRLRQFQFQKTPSVTVWREMRRIKGVHKKAWFDRILAAVDCGCFASYFDFMGGYETPSRSRPVSTLYEEVENKYGEPAKKVAGVDGIDVIEFTREKVWKMVKKGAEAVAEAVTGSSLGSLVSTESGVSRFPWSSVNNCAQNENENKECRFTKFLRPDFLSTVTAKEAELSYLGGNVEKLWAAGNLVKQHCNRCGSESDIYGDSDTYICMTCASDAGWPQGKPFTPSFDLGADTETRKYKIRF